MFVQHNELRNITSQLMEEVCLDVGIEPSLQPISNEVLHYKTANTDYGARLNVATNFWGKDRQRSFFDVRVFNQFARSYVNSSLPQCYHKNEECRAYDE